MEIRNTRALKQYNKFIILNEIIENQPVSRRDLTKKLDVSHATISYIVKDLIEDGLIVETEFLESTGGRPPRLLEFKGDSKYLVAIEISEKYLYYSLFNLNLELISMDFFQAQGQTADEIITILKQSLQAKLADLGLTYDKLVGMGISTPGIYEEDIDRLTDSTSKIWEDINIKRQFEEVFELPVFLENDANMAAYYEWAYGAGQNYSNLFYIFIADGIGGGIIINDRLYKGIHGKAGEIGHIKVREEGELCECGGTGCLETVSSARAIVKKVNKLIQSGQESILIKYHKIPYDFNDIARGYWEGDALCQEVINEALNYLISALSSIINIYDPGLLIVGDMYNFMDDQLIKEIGNELKKICYPNIIEKLNIVKKTDKENLQLHATAAFVFDNWKRNV